MLRCVFAPLVSASSRVPKGHRKVVLGCQRDPRDCEGDGGLTASGTGSVLGCCVTGRATHGVDRLEVATPSSSARSELRAVPWSGNRVSAVGTGSSGRDSSSDGAGRGEFGAPSRNGSSVTAARLLVPRRVLLACFFDRGLHPTMMSGHRRWQHRQPDPLARRIAARAVSRVCVMVRRGLLGAQTTVLFRSCRHLCRCGANRASGR